MTSPRLTKGGTVQVDPTTGATLRAIALQHHPDSLSRTLQVQSAGGDDADRSQALTLKGPAIETFQVEAKIDATDRLEFPDQNVTTVSTVLHPQIPALELLVQPTSHSLQTNDALSQAGVLELDPEMLELDVVFSGGGLEAVHRVGGPA